MRRVVTNRLLPCRSQIRRSSSVANPDRIRACGRVLPTSASKMATAMVVCSAWAASPCPRQRRAPRPIRRWRLPRYGPGNPRPPHPMRARPARAPHLRRHRDGTQERLSHLDDLLYGIYLLREASARTLDELMGSVSGCPSRSCGATSRTSVSPLAARRPRADATDDRFGSARSMWKPHATTSARPGSTRATSSSWRASSARRPKAPRPHSAGGRATSVPPMPPVSSMPRPWKSGRMWPA